jgi:isopentenyldiphosphate isomerase
MNTAELWDVLDEHGNKTGRLHKRSSIPEEFLKPGEYHLVVHVWIINNKGEFLISKRTPNKPYPNMWECTGGSAIAGDDSLTTAIKEVKEELGINLDPANGQIFKRYKKQCDDCGGDFIDVWLFRQEIELSDVIFQPEETCDAILAGKEKINQMINDGIFIGREIFSYLDELFCAADFENLYTGNTI